MNVTVIVLDNATREPVRDAKGDALVLLTAFPRKDELLSFGQKAYRVMNVWHVNNGIPRALVTEIVLPMVAELSSK